LLNVYNNLKTIRQSKIDQVVVESLLQDRITKRIYIATNYGMFSEIPSDLKKSNSILVNKVIDLGFLSHLIQTSDGTLWVCSQDGLYSFNTIKNRVNFHLALPTSNQRIPVTGNPLFEDKDGTLWIAGTGEGIIRFDKDLKKYDIIKYNPDDKYSINDNSIQSVIEDRSGVVWCGSNKWDRKKWKFNSIEYLQKGKSGLINPNIFSLAIDKRDRLWIGSISGLQILNLKDHKFYNIQNDFSVLKVFEGKEIWNIIPDGFDENIMWISCGMTLYKYNLKDNKLFSYTADLKTNYVYKINNIIQLLPFNKNYLIAATSEGLLKLDKNTNQLYGYKKDPDNEQSLSDDFTISLYKTKSNELWIGTKVGGLDQFDPETNTILRILSLRNNFRPNPIYQIFEDDIGNLWLGTYRDGLYKYDIGKKSTMRFNVEDGLPENGIMIIQKDKKGNLWLGTLNGLSKFNLQKNILNNFFIEDGLPNNFFIMGASAKDSNGTLFMGTRGGLVYFHPDSIVIDSIPPQVVIQNISLFNRPDDKLEYEGFISEIEEIILPHNQNDLHFEYVGLHYGESQRNKYKYILEGFDKDWIDAGNLRSATYTNLDPGEYKFRVKACNRDGIWNEAGASLKVIINPPLWATTWAYLFYIILFGSILYYAWRIQLKRVRVKHEFEMSKFEAQKLHEVDEMKSRFFANISHEFRTPLTLILGPAEKISNAESSNPAKEANIIRRNATRLMELVNQLLDLSKLDAGKLKLEASKGNIVSFVKNIALSFESLAESKDIKLKILAEEEYLELFFDKDKMTKIIANLLSNSFKFTKEGGEVTLTINNTNNHSIEIKIRDTGIGIPKSELPKLFDRFYQMDSSHSREFEGTGIGLSLVKELVELHHGIIKVDSVKDDDDNLPNLKGTSWTEFSLEFPIGRVHLKDEELLQEKVLTSEKNNFTLNKLTKDKIDYSIKDYSSSTNNISTHQIENVSNENKNIILIVEDNYDMRQYIRESLLENFSLEEAINGEQGIRIAEKVIPDLIITDLMMPKIDGNELTKRLKNNEKTSHIPIIILTAKSGQENLIEGLETGADEYLTKPFDIKELKLRIANLLKLRKSIQKKILNGEIKHLATDKKLSLYDQNFLDKVHNVVEQHLSEEEFSIEEFSFEIGLSRTHLHRKLKALTGKSASLYVRTIRLRKAKQMIEEQQGNISEIAYSVGFSSPAYFSRCFKEEFGYPPSH
jgi:signal transduction histidine kinase/DNA-binding response OmpR family regulator/ligand-binding sensor domain-containing protein